MKKFIVIILFISLILGLTLINISLKNDSTNIDIKIKNIEAFGDNENGEENPCTIPGAICMFYDTSGNPIFYPGLTLDI